MNSINVEGVVLPAIVHVGFSRADLIIGLGDGRELRVPLAWYPRLAMAKRKELMKFEISPGGYGIHWPALDEDLSVLGFLYPSGVATDRARARAA